MDEFAEIEAGPGEELAEVGNAPGLGDAGQASEVASPDALHDAGRRATGMLSGRLGMSGGAEVMSSGSVDEAAITPMLSWPVVGVGASAGGLQAFLEVLRHLDSSTGMAFVLITHLAREHKSYMSEILANHTRMRVLPIQDGVEPEPNHLYVLLPNEAVTLCEGKFQVTAREQHGANMPVDLFFRSLATDQKNHAVGLVLSGADADGASGLKAIKGEGGIALVQAPETAQHSSMPIHSIQADHVDLVLPPAELGQELNRIGKQFAAAGVRSLEQGESNEEQFQRVLQMLRNVAGLELRLYKPQTLRRRIARRMVLLRMDSLGDYLKYLHARSDELMTLHEEVLINVTRFFRDPDVWTALATDVMPALFRDRAVGRPLRIWSAGCSTGEEAYSLAITVIEYLTLHGLDTPVQIFGTDASERSIEWARTAIYPDTLATELSAERIRRYFVKVDRGYQVSKRVRDTCIFARQNLSNDPPFSHIDLLSCRNVLIYFNQVLQRQVMQTFHYALEPSGVMLLGMSESLREYSGMFSTLDRKTKIYAKVGTSVSNGFDLPRYFAAASYPGPTLADMTDGAGVGNEADSETYSAWQDIELQRAADRTVLARFAPPGLIVDQDLNVMQVRGQMSPFVELSVGAVSWNLLRILQDEIAGQVRQQVEHAVKNTVPVTITPVQFETGGVRRDLQIDVIPIISSHARMRCFLVLFQAAVEPSPGQVAQAPIVPSLLTEDEKDAISAQLRLDLSTTRFHLHSLIEERDAHNQELVSANEEIQSANEELQSSNEELETTKEELQSTNEELQTVNEELQQRNQVLTQTGNDLSNLLTSVNIPLLMLTNDLRIRQFTPPMQRLLNVRPSDVGRSISEIRLQLSVENIEPILLDVMETLGTREIEVQDREGRWNLLRVRPYRTAENRIEGLVVVLVDIDQLRRSQQELLESRDFVSSVVESVPVAIVVLRSDCTILRHNTAFRDLTRIQGSELEHRSLPDLVQMLWGLDGIKDKLTQLTEAPSGELIEFEHHSETSDRRILAIKGQSLVSDGGRVVLLVIEDITVRREAERRIAQQKRALEEQVHSAAAELDRTQEELRGLTNHLFTVQEEERQHVARELHDDVSQRLSLMEMTLREMSATDGQGARLTGLLDQMKELNGDVRRISHRLHPAILDDLGLATALKALVMEFGEREGMPATFQSSDVPDVTSRRASAALYRIAQEALRNVSKHAGKTHVKVMLEGRSELNGSGSLELEVLDLGVGFDQENEADGRPRGGALGLISMKERARLAHGTFTVESALGRGTRVRVSVPAEDRS